MENLSHHLGHRLTSKYLVDSVMLYCKDDKAELLSFKMEPVKGSPLDIYCQVILHQGCAIPPIGEITSRLHRWDECREQKFYRRIAKKTQHKLKSNGIVIGEWINERKFKIETR